WALVTARRLFAASSCATARSSSACLASRRAWTAASRFRSVATSPVSRSIRSPSREIVVVSTPLRSRAFESSASLASSLDSRLLAGAGALPPSSATSTVAAASSAAMTRRGLSILREASEAALSRYAGIYACNPACGSALAAGILDSQQLGRRLLLHLQRRVGDAEALVQEQLDPPSRQVPVAPRRHDDMGSESPEARGDRPDVKVVYGANALFFANRRAGGVDVDAGRGSLHQHAERLGDQPPGGGEDQAGDQQADDWVDGGGAAREHHRARHGNAERAERVSGAVAENALEVD